MTLATAAASTTTFAQVTTQAARADATRAQRPVSDDALIDQHLVAALLAPATTADQTAPGLVPNVASTDGADQYMAAVGPAMRPLLSTFNAIWPTAGQITTYFGERGGFSPRGHSGVDIAGPQGTPVVGADAGEVLKAYWNSEGYGGLVVIAHRSGYETWYGHLARFDVDVGEQVRRGQQIALMGSTGLSTGSHLHFEVRQDGQLCDPLAFLNEANLAPAD